MKKIIILFTVLLSFSCEKDNLKTKKIFYEDGSIKREINYKIIKKDTIYDGLMKDYYNDGVLKYEALMKEGVFHGKLSGYYPSGNIKFTGFKDNNLKHGVYFKYFDNSKSLNKKIEIKEKWKNGKKILNQYLYDENGRLLEYLFHSPNGEIAYTESYDNKGKIIDVSGSKVPMIIKPNADDTYYKGDTLNVNIFCVFSQKTSSEVYTRIKGVNNEWKKEVIKDVDSEINYQHIMNEVGEYLFQIKYLDLDHPKDYLNEFKFSVIDTIIPSKKSM